MPRRRRGLHAVTLALGAAVPLAIGPAVVHAQTAEPDSSTVLMRPGLDGDPNAPPGFRRTDVDRRPLATGRFKLEKFGNPPASGADSIGFDSTNALLKKEKEKKAAAAQKAKVAPPALPPSTARRDPLARPGASPTPPTPPDTTGVILARPAPPRRPPVEEDPFAPLGIRAGAFTFRPAVEFTAGYDSNPDRTGGGSGSSYLVVAPELQVKSDWSRHELAADIHGSYSQYDRDFVPSLNRPSLQGAAERTPTREENLK